MRSLEREKKFLCALRRVAGDTPQVRLSPQQWAKPARELGLSTAEIQEVWLRLIEHGLVVRKPASESFALSSKGVDLADDLLAQASALKKPRSRIGF